MRFTTLLVCAGAFLAVFSVDVSATVAHRHTRNGGDDGDSTHAKTKHGEVHHGAHTPRHAEKTRDHDECARGGELRRNFGCVAVRHTKHDHCCWMKRDGTHGKLPHECCGTGWETSKCEAKIEHVCSTHPDDM